MNFTSTEAPVSQTLFLFQTLSQQKAANLFNSQTEPSLRKFVLIRNFYFSISRHNVESLKEPMDEDIFSTLFDDSMEDNICLDEESWFDACLDDLDQIQDECFFESSDDTTLAVHEFGPEPFSTSLTLLEYSPSLFSDEHNMIPDSFNSSRLDNFLPL